MTVFSNMSSSFFLVFIPYTYSVSYTCFVSYRFLTKIKTIIKILKITSSALAIESYFQQPPLPGHPIDTEITYKTKPVSCPLIQHLSWSPDFSSWRYQWHTCCPRSPGPILTIPSLFLPRSTNSSFKTLTFSPFSYTPPWFSPLHLSPGYCKSFLIEYHSSHLSSLQC